MSFLDVLVMQKSQKIPRTEPLDPRGGLTAPSDPQLNFVACLASGNIFTTLTHILYLRLDSSTKLF